MYKSVAKLVGIWIHDQPVGIRIHLCKCVTAQPHTLTDFEPLGCFGGASWRAAAGALRSLTARRRRDVTVLAVVVASLRLHAEPRIFGIKLQSVPCDKLAVSVICFVITKHFGKSLTVWLRRRWHWQLTTSFVEWRHSNKAQYNHNRNTPPTSAPGWPGSNENRLVHTVF